MADVIAHPPDTSGVQTGAVWLTDAGWYVLVLWPLTESVWNIGMWPEAGGIGTIPGPSAKGSMIAADVLAVGGRLVREPDQEILDVINEVCGGAQ